tara:strand:+ start:2008 stop:2205 length:198 start_codon:yes stop_codon:yes gene_type:complete
MTTLEGVNNVLEKPFSRSDRICNTAWVLRTFHILLLAFSRLMNTELCSFRSLLGRSEYKERSCDA